jgi:predicted nucleotidyltransferase
MGALLDHRRRETERRISRLKRKLERAAGISQGKACVYVTGSFGRGEASPYSDLDLFIVGQKHSNQRSLARLDEIRLKAELIEATQKLGIPPFSGDGEYLTHHTVDDLVKNLGQPEDDITNTLTARLLLLLESRPLLEESIYRKVITSVIEPYWRDYDDHKDAFMPAYLANDILRLWRTFCVNYEARTAPAPPREKAKRKLKNYKLKHSRLLTCFSALLYLSAVYAKRKTVTHADVVRMTYLSPTGRLEWLLYQSHIKNTHAKIRKLLEVYEQFLKDTDAPQDVLIHRFLDRKLSHRYQETGNKLGDLVFEVLEGIGESNRFHRLLVV